LRDAAKGLVKDYLEMQDAGPQGLA